MNDAERDRIAAAINVLRPDWPLKSVRTLLDDLRLATRPRRDAMVALAWVACESETKTPARVFESGPWWRATITEDAQGYRPPRKDEECQTHLGNYADACRGCAADRAAGDQTEPGDPRKPDRAAELATIRAELAAVQTRTCGHGIDRGRAKCAECEPVTAQPCQLKEPA